MRNTILIISALRRGHRVKTFLKKEGGIGNGQLGGG